MDGLPDTVEMDLVYRCAEAWNRLNLDGFADVLAHDVSFAAQCMFHEPTGREEVEAFFHDRMAIAREKEVGSLQAEIGLWGDDLRPCVLWEFDGEPPLGLFFLDERDGLVCHIFLSLIGPHPSTAYRTGIYPGLT